MNMSPNLVKQGDAFKQDEAMPENYKQMEVGDPAVCFNRPPLVRSGSIFRSILRFVLVLLLVLGVSCVGRRLTKANVDEVTEGMSKKQVESILGPPTEIDNKDFVIMKKTIYLYRQGKDTVTVVFKDDKVTDKQSTLSD
jgi:SmpA / OmlA family